jgi:hypothetical protein
MLGKCFTTKLYRLLSVIYFGNLGKINVGREKSRGNLWMSTNLNLLTRFTGE